MCFEWLSGLLYDFMSSCIFQPYAVWVLFCVKMRGHICAPEVISSAPSSITMKAWNIGEIARRCGPTKPWPNWKSSDGMMPSLPATRRHRQNSKEHESWKDTYRPIGLKVIDTNGEALVNSEALQRLHKSFWKMYELCVNKLWMKWTQITQVTLDGITPEVLAWWQSQGNKVIEYSEIFEDGFKRLGRWTCRIMYQV